ncbi:MAG: YrzE family protein [Rubrobacter sp.]|nr:YrzE family protein [Rubrobacter sp.]MBA3950624.1 YrzE family protein [Rubrobacter sp.]MDQ3376619.1 YrzE family protein [Actinomycetota bacterium]
MTERPGDRPEERRRTGPLGDEADEQETRRVPLGENRQEDTRREPPGGTDDADEQETRQVPQGSPQGPPQGNGEKETRIIRTPGHPDTTADATPYPRGYFEEAEDREDRLRDMYGGVDWLASFLGFVFALVAGAIFSAVAGIVLGPLGFSPNLSGPLGAAVITGLVLLGVLIFLTYFFGGYVAGRLARFDGGRNGAMLLVWTFLTVILLALAAGVFSGFLPGGAADAIGGFVDSALSAIGGVSQAGIVGIVVAVAALLLALLGGVLGGRLGSRYHAEIDRTT